MPMFEERPGPGRKATSSPRAHQRHESPERPSTPSKPIAIPATAPLPLLSRRLSEVSIRTELCEGLLLDSPPYPLVLGSSNRSSRALPSSLRPNEPTTQPPDARSSSSPSQDTTAVSDRAELIERLKRGESPTWVPNRHVSSSVVTPGEFFSFSSDSSAALQLESLLHNQHSRSPTRSPRPPSAGSQTSTLLPAADISAIETERIPLEAHDHDAEAAERLQDGLNIERPRSALHSGDFTPSNSDREQTHADGKKTRRQPGNLQNQEEGEETAGQPFYSGGASSTWLSTTPPRHYTPFVAEPRTGRTSSLAEFGVFRSRQSSISSSVSSSFVYKPPTSPLVQSESNFDDDDENGRADLSVSMNSFDIGFGSPSNSSLRSNSRRHTLHSATHAHLLHSYSAPYPIASPSQSLPRSDSGPTHLRRESQGNMFPYQAHQPRRSLSSAPNNNMHTAFASSTPQTPLIRSRRPSFASDTSPLQHASMVGSYEESILRGRMSTTPSRPLDFLAQIGVLGLGAKCKPSLRCPPHVTLPFSAVFYSYGSTPHGRSKTEDGPSPYVGMVDLENGLPHPEVDERSKRKILRSRAAAARTSHGQQVENGGGSTCTTGPDAAPDSQDVVMEDAGIDMPTVDGERPTRASTRTQKRGSHTPKVPPGGAYRIPQQGQLQIIIKNQNKTAVKLFLIPYDLTDMEPGTKTFIRQRSYSGGPIIDNVPAIAEAASSEQPILRYLVHIHICCPSRGRYYLYNNMRVVFANRVPDGKEKLRNELKFPEPRYSPYKPIRVMYPPMGSTTLGGITAGGNAGPGAMLAAEKAYRRRSSGLFAGRGPLAYGPGQQSLPAPMPIPTTRSTTFSHQNVESFSFADGSVPVDPVPFGITQSPLSSPTSLFMSQTSSYVPAKAAGRAENIAGSVDSTTTPPLYNKLSRGDVGYGGNAFLPLVNGAPALAEGLLSQRLRSLEVEKTLPAKETAENPLSD